jgi:hypothetical protein
MAIPVSLLGDSLSAWPPLLNYTHRRAEWLIDQGIVGVAARRRMSLAKTAESAKEETAQASK